MDITTLAAWGEFLGGIAVVVSLVYLASQIRQNSRLLDAAAEDSRIQTYNAASALIGRRVYDTYRDRARTRRAFHSAVRVRRPDPAPPALR